MAPFDIGGAAPDTPTQPSLLGPRSLDQLAHDLATSHVPIAPSARPRFRVSRIVHDLQSRLTVSYRSIADAHADGRPITPAAQWLLDNYHVVTANLNGLPALLPPAVVAVLPMVQGGARGTQTLRVYDLLREYASHVDCRLDARTLTAFLESYQLVSLLTMAELWVVPAFFRLVALEHLEAIAAGTARALAARRTADQYADAALASAGAVTPDSSWLPPLGDAPHFLVLPFTVQLIERLRYHAEDLPGAMESIRHMLAEHGLTVDECVHREHNRQSGNNVSASNIITSLRASEAIEWRDFFCTLSQVIAELRDLPSFHNVDSVTQDHYLAAIAELARGSRRSEPVLAGLARRSAAAATSPPENDLAWHLLGPGRDAFEKTIGYAPGLRGRLRRVVQTYPGAVYAGSIAILSGGLLGLTLHAGLSPTPSIALVILGVLAAFPAVDLAVRLVNLLVTHGLKAQPLPRLDLSGGIPPAGKTLVAMPVLLTGAADIGEYCNRLEVHYAANPDPMLRFALVSDWTDSPEERVAEDLPSLELAVAGIDALNKRYPLGTAENRFYLFHRCRQWNGGEKCWMGWERKRGKLMELNQLLLAGTPGSFIPPPGRHLAVPTGVRYLLTLDGDTQVPIGAIRRLVGTALHPLNQPRHDRNGRVRSGFGVLQPRVTPLMPDHADRSLYQWVASAGSGLDPYGGAISDVYQDLFGEGIFTGKGLYHIQTFAGALRDQVPENAVLSHDLLEGQLSRCGLVTDVEIFEEVPSHSEVAAARHHRWTRGDWQLLPWLVGSRGRSLTSLGRWQILDNLRRSLDAPAALATLVGAWCLPDARPLAFITLILAGIYLPGFLGILLDLLRPRTGIAFSPRLRSAVIEMVAELGRGFVAVALLCQNAWLSVDAVARALTRLITRRRLLEWITAAQVKARTTYALPMFIWPLRSSSIVVVTSTALIVWLNPAALPSAAPWLFLFWLAPLVARVLSLPRPKYPDLPDADRAMLRSVARRTWLYFSTFVTAADHHLPPDNYQDDPHPVVAHRTSPTNIGLYLLAALAARDFGWISLQDLVARWSTTMATLLRLKRVRGHYLNWYDTQTLNPLHPEYVSTVDSGNLAGHLLALRHACLELLRAPVPGGDPLVGPMDTLDLFTEALDGGADNHRLTMVDSGELKGAAAQLRARLRQLPPGPGSRLVALAQCRDSASVLHDLAGTLAVERGEQDTQYQLWATLLATELEGHVADLGSFMPTRLANADEALASRWEKLAQELSLYQSLEDFPGRSREAADRLEEMDVPEPALLAEEVRRCADSASRLIRRLGKLADLAGRIAAEMDFGFLYDRQRGLFSIGYRVDDDKLDTSYYDLLASEARLASLLAIGNGAVPLRHWFRLGRPLTGRTYAPTLASWSGSMFEYLMPALVMHSPVDSLLDNSCRRAVKRQIAYGRDNGTPWGISESAFNVRDRAFTYQYADFGVPGLGLKRGLGRNLVVAPYATALAAMYVPGPAVSNFSQLRKLGALGAYGFYDAVDFTPDRLPAGHDHAVVQTYMAHHQGMTLVALDNVVHGEIMQARFHREPLVQAASLLLQERAPRAFRAPAPPAELPPTAKSRAEGETNSRHMTDAVTNFPVPHLLSNRDYSVMITAAGSGYSTCSGRAITRWREDSVREDLGTFIYLRDALSGEVWSAGFEPVGREPQLYEVCFDEERGRIHRVDGSLSTTLEVVVSPEENAELRRVTLVNSGTRERLVDVTSYAEVVLTTFAADEAHRTFSNLFVQTEYIPEHGALLACRRPRDTAEVAWWSAHVVSSRSGDGVGYETDRLRFLGRHGQLSAPQAVMDGRPLSNTVGAVLDPVFSLRVRVRIPPGEKTSLTFATLAAESRESAIEIADKMNDAGAFERVSTLAWTYCRAGLHYLGVTEAQARLYQDLLGVLIFANPGMRAPGRILAASTLPSTALWRFGISGDRPIVVMRCLDAEHQAFAADLLRAHAYWESKRLAVDVVLYNESAHSYLQDLQHSLEDLVRRHSSFLGDEQRGHRGGAYVVRAADMQPQEEILLLASARLVVNPREGTLAEQFSRRLKLASTAPPRMASPPADPDMQPALPVPVRQFDNGLGGFSEDGREYLVVLEGNRCTPAPWSNVIANPHFGCLVTESGSSFTWWGNSRENQLTPWSNDPVTDPSGEILYLRDERTGACWTPTPRPIRLPAARYLVAHGQGYSRFQTVAYGIESTLNIYVSPEDPVKFRHLTLTNRSGRPRQLSVSAYVEWALGPRRAGGTVIVAERHASGAILAGNPANPDFGGRVAFLSLSGRTTATSSRLEFMGRHGSPLAPMGMRRQLLSNQVGVGTEACGALRTIIELEPGATLTLLSLLGQAEDRAACDELLARHGQLDDHQVLRAVRDFWDRQLGTIRVQTPDRSIDYLFNRWLLYQALSCRVWGRAGFYQAGGAYGFRDQLQDCMALVHSAPGVVRAHLLRAASRQFEEGDVQHWWHPPSGKGVRTRCVDDRLWLPLAVLRYVDVHDDPGLLDELVPFLVGKPLDPAADDAYFEPQVTEQQASLYEHCARAIDASLLTGPHGLPLMGSGDWNDGFNRVGTQGRGESTWMGWFLATIIPRFSTIAVARDDTARAQSWNQSLGAILHAMEHAGWDGTWYRRGYFDDGTPLGSAARPECRIDSIAQSWAVLSGAAPAERAETAMDSAEEALLRPADDLLVLFTPPFDRSEPHPGYIRGYLPGMRENGGQYNHAAIWHLMATARLDRHQVAGEILEMLNPIRRSMTRRKASVYRVEPYVMAADISSEPPNAQRGGWTWYTGSAGWLYQAILEELLGVKIRRNVLTIRPVLPPGWPGAVVEYRGGNTECRIEIVRAADASGSIRITADGQAVEGLSVPLRTDRHTQIIKVAIP